MKLLNNTARTFAWEGRMTYVDLERIKKRKDQQREISDSH